MGMGKDIGSFLGGAIPGVGAVLGPLGGALGGLFDSNPAQPDPEKLLRMAAMKQMATQPYQSTPVNGMAPQSGGDAPLQPHNGPPGLSQGAQFGQTLGQGLSANAGQMPDMIEAIKKMLAQKQGAPMDPSMGATDMSGTPGNYA